jgi:RecA-family ATPase
MGDGAVMALHADRAELARFIGALFPYADEGTFVSLRAFDQEDRGQPASLVTPVRINGNLERLIDAATAAAEDVANRKRKIVFAPPICTFSNADRARVEDLANGLVLSVDLDDGDTHAARTRLEHLLGPATIVVQSGGEASDPLTGEVFPKVHLHWRLSEPTREDPDHYKLRQARDLASRLVGADPTGKPVVHPLRWPGSWNMKAAPKMARIVAFNDAAEINLDEALEAVSAAVDAAGMAAVNLPVSGKPEAALPLVGGALMAIPNAGTAVHYDDWIRMGYAVHRATGGSGYDIWRNWSALSEKFNETETDLAWKRIGRAIVGSKAPRTIGAGTIFFEAKAHGWVRPDTTEPPPADPTDPDWWASIERNFVENQQSAEVAEVAAEVPPDLREGSIIDPRDWTAPAPLREWLIQDWIPIGAVTGLYADGGVGKSLLMQQLLTCTAMGRPWLGMDVQQGFAFGMFCEDDGDELHRRQEAINRALAVDMQGLGLLRYSSRVGFDNLLMTFSERNQGELTPLYTSMVKFLGPHKPRLIVIDTIADTFGGDEIKRVHARQFVQGVGGNLARAFDCAVVMIGHVSMTGMNSGAGTSGSTAWNNTFRSRMYLTKPSKDEGGDDDTRLLSRKKANYAATNEDLKLVWNNGCFGLPEQQMAQPQGLTWPQIYELFDEVDRAWKAQEPWSVVPQTRAYGRYLPTWMQVTFGIREQAAAKLLGQWQAGKYLHMDLIDARSKQRGLRVVRRLVP